MADLIGPDARAILREIDDPKLRDDVRSVLVTMAVARYQRSTITRWLPAEAVAAASQTITARLRVSNQTRIPISNP